MKILVTGATGFLGRHVIATLSREKHILITTSSAEVDTGKYPWLEHTTPIPLDLATVSGQIDYFRYFNEPDRMIHLAWEGLPHYKQDFHETVNLPRHKALLENMIRNGLSDLTVAGTCLEYGMQEGCLTEGMPVFPAVSYARAKDRLRRHLEGLGTYCSFSLKWTRLFYMYGEGQNPNSLLSQLKKALSAGEAVFPMSGGQQVRDFLPVEDVAAAVVRIALQKKTTGLINICSQQPVTVQHFVEDYLARAGKKITLGLGQYPYTDYEPMRFWGDNSKLKSILHND